MKVLITGATGLIGQSLVKHLLAKGYVVNFLTTQENKRNSIPNGKGFLWNVETQTIDANCIDGVKVIIHLAGASIGKRWTNNYKKEIINSRVAGAKLLHTLMAENKNQVEQLISASAVGIYQDSLTEMHSETSKHFGNGFLTAVTQQWEKSVDAFQELNVQVTKLRTGVVLAPNDGALQQMIKPIQMGFGSALGSGKQHMSWIHIDDLIKIYAYILENQYAGVYNAVAPNVVTNQRFTQQLATQLQKKIWLPNVPKFVLNVVLGEMHLLLCESQQVSSEKIVKAGFKFQFPTLEEALTNIFSGKA